MYVIGIDPGTRRVGVAIGDTSTGIATPYEMWPRQQGAPLDRRLRECIDEWEAGLVVVGLPRSLDGSEGPAAASARQLADELRGVMGVPIELHDERFSTVTAQASLRAGGVDTRAGRNVVDAVAASVILQSWFDAHRKGAP